MCWVVDNRTPTMRCASRRRQPARAEVRGSSRGWRWFARAAFVGSFLMIPGILAGCGRPRGVLFPPIDPPCVWPAPPDTPRIKLLGVLVGSRDLKAEQPGLEVIKAALRGPRPPIEFSSPHGVAFHGPDVLAIADGAGGAVHLINLTDRSHRMISGFESEKQRFGVPLGVAFAGARLFVTDALRHEVIELDASGSFRRRFGEGVLARPVGIAYVPARDRLYVVDGGAHRLVVFDPGGTVTGTIGRRGSAEGEFNFPTHISSAGDRLLVADTGNFRVQVLDLDGTWIGTIGQKGDGAGDLSLPKGVAFDSEGHIYIADAHFENVQVFDESGQLLMAFGQEGAGPGKFSLPVGLAIDQEDRIWVADSGNRRIQVFAYMRTSS